MENNITVEQRTMKREQERKTTSMRRAVVRGYERELGKKRLHRTIDEKLGKYKVRVEGYEFVPAMMHLLKRYCADLPENKRSELDVNMAKALDAIPEARKILGNMVVRHDAISLEQKRRVFSPKYLDLKTEQAIDIAQMANITKRSLMVRNKTIRDLAGNSAMYEVDFGYLYCADESDPEWGGDEPYVVFGVITEKMAEIGTPAWTFQTPVYEDVDDGDRRPKRGYENLRLYGFTGPKAIDSPVLITATCIEHDLGDVSETTDVVRSALTAVAIAGASAGGKGWIVTGAAVICIAVSYLFDLFARDDQIADSIALTLTEAEADAMTSSFNPTILDPLHFDGGDNDGIYDVYLRLTNTTKPMTPVSKEKRKRGSGGSARGSARSDRLLKKDIL